jgi:hypothetical protein
MFLAPTDDLRRLLRRIARLRAALVDEPSQRNNNMPAYTPAGIPGAAPPPIPQDASRTVDAGTLAHDVGVETERMLDDLSETEAQVQVWSEGKPEPTPVDADQPFAVLTRLGFSTSKVSANRDDSSDGVITSPRMAAGHPLHGPRSPIPPYNLVDPAKPPSPATGTNCDQLSPVKVAPNTPHRGIAVPPLSIAGFHHDNCEAGSAPLLRSPRRASTQQLSALWVTEVGDS